MNKKLKDEFDRQISSSPLSKSEDHKRFNEWLETKRTSKKKRYWVPQVITVLLLLGLATVLLNTNGNIFSMLSTDQHPFEEFYEEKSFYSEHFELIDYEVGVFHEQDVLAIYDGPTAQDTSVTELHVGYFQHSEDDRWISIRGRPLSMSNPSVWEVGEGQYIYTLNTDKSIKEVRGNENTFNKITLDHHILWYNTDSSLYTDLHQQSDQSFNEVNIDTPDELLSTEEGKLSVRLISEEVLQGEDGMQLYDSVAGDLSEFKALSNFGGFKTKYPTLPVNQDPVFLFFDTETLVYHTNNLNDAIAFANDYYLEDEIKTLGEEFNILLGDAEVEKGYVYHSKEEASENVEISNIELDNILRETSDLKLEEQHEPVITDYKIEVETNDNRSITIEFSEDGLVLMENSNAVGFYSIKGKNELMESVKGH